MKKLIMLRGLPASGKTTYALDEVRKSGGVLKRVNKDELRMMLHAGEWSDDRERFVCKIRDKIIVSALISGHSIIVDDTNLHPKHEARLRQLAHDYRAEFEIVQMNADVETCVSRDANRSAPIGEKVIRQMNELITKS